MVGVAPDVAAMMMMAFAIKETGHWGPEGRGSGNVGARGGSSGGSESISVAACVIKKLATSLLVGVERRLSSTLLSLCSS
jgi:hypothetical protein